MCDLEAACDWKRLEFQRPAFRLADLRLVGDLLSDPVTRAIRNDAFQFQKPIWSEGRPALVRLGETLSDALAMAIRRGLSFPEPPDWSLGSAALCCVFGLNYRHHLFRAEPIAWAKFTEPQFTGGFGYFLGVPERIKRLKRTRALLKALGAAELSKDLSEVTVTAEALTSGKKRIDLLIEWRDTSGLPYAVAIEAKLGHRVTSGQLPAYRTHLDREKKVPPERRLLIVVSPRFSADTRDALQRQRTGEWRWVAWRDLLLAHERALSADYDDDAYRQFRRTLWDQTG